MSVLSAGLKEPYELYENLQGKISSRILMESYARGGAYENAARAYRT